jgi:small subunit ribosomal protein S9
LEEREEQQPAEAEVTETPETTEAAPEAAGTTEAAETVEAPEAAPAAEVEAPPPAEPPQADAAPAQEEAAPDVSAEADEPAPPVEPEPPVEQEPVRTLADLAADARYSATGKRKSSVARVIVRPGSGQFLLNGRTLEQYFPRRTHQVVVRQPLDAAGYADRIDVRARIHGGGISGQADALRHGIAKALIEADPALRSELKRRQLLTRDPRVKERYKAGLKKARKRPQFSKR